MYIWEINLIPITNSRFLVTITKYLITHSGHIFSRELTEPFCFWWFSQKHHCFQIREFSYRVTCSIPWKCLDHDWRFFQREGLNEMPISPIVEDLGHWELVEIFCVEFYPVGVVVLEGPMCCSIATSLRTKIFKDMITIFKGNVKDKSCLFSSIPFLVHILDFHDSIDINNSSHIEIGWSVELEVGVG